MIYKVCYQETKVHSPRREETKSLHIEVESGIDARQCMEENIPYNTKFAQLLEGSRLEYEKENADFSLAEF